MSKQAKPHMTATIAETIEHIKRMVSKEDLKHIKDMTEADLIKLRMSFGMWIRNTFGLCQSNEALLKETGEHHPDYASFVIIKALWADLNNV
jgi:hypothetical protein